MSQSLLDEDTLTYGSSDKLIRVPNSLSIHRTDTSESRLRLEISAASRRAAWARSPVDYLRTRGTTNQDDFQYMGCEDASGRSDYRLEHEGGKRKHLFQKGRDFKAASDYHKFTIMERMKMLRFESLDYQDCVSQLYKDNLVSRKKSYRWVFKAVVMILVGVAVALMAYLLRQSVSSLVKYKLKLLKQTFKKSDHSTYMNTWAMNVLYGVLLTFLAATPIVFLVPQASGSGIPEVMAYLNGIHMPKVFNIRTLITKAISCICAVASGLPVGPEGPMIHIGAMIGAGVSQGRSRTLRINNRVFSLFFKQFRNNKDHQDFISAGSAAGVAAAFSAPVGGLLFVMEEIASFWNFTLTANIFFTCMVTCFSSAYFTTQFSDWKTYNGISLNYLVMFPSNNQIPVTIFTLVPSVFIGVLGGLMGATFNFLNLKFVRFRSKYARPKHDTSNRKKMIFKLMLLIEPVLIVVIVASYFLISLHTECRSMDSNVFDVPDMKNNLVQFTCDDEVNQYSPLATLTLQSGHESVGLLFSQNTTHLFGIKDLAIYLPFYFVFACYTCGSSVASGVVIPMLYIGALLGRLIGLALYNMLECFGFRGEYLDWADPGVFAFVGAASFFAGVSRLTISLAVIMLELTNATPFMLPLMMGVMTAKYIGDLFTHPLYHALLEVKCIPFLNTNPEIQNLHLMTAGDVMSTPITIQQIEKAGNIIQIISSCLHNAFPVVENETNVLVGLITRTQLDIIINGIKSSQMDIQEMLNIKDPKYLRDPISRHSILGPDVDSVDVNLSYYMNLSPYTVAETFSLENTYIMFRSLGLRHLLVTKGVEVTGIITRKDLMGQHIEEQREEKEFNIRKNIPSGSSAGL